MDEAIFYINNTDCPVYENGLCKVTETNDPYKVCDFSSCPFIYWVNIAIATKEER